MLFSSHKCFVQQKNEFNTKTPGVNNRFDLTDKLAYESVYAFHSSFKRPHNNLFYRYYQLSLTVAAL